MGFADLKLEIHRKAFRRGMSLKVLPSGVVQVNAAKMTSQRAIDQFVSQHKKWIQKQVLRYKDFQKEYPQKKFLESEYFLFLGKWYALKFKTHLKRRLFVCLEDEFIVIYICDSKRVSFSPKDTQKELHNFYKNYAKIILNHRVNLFSKKMNLYPKRVSFMRAQTRWGSCSSQGNLSLNWKLIAAPIDVLEYVIIHELAHLKHQNHSSDFWDLVKSFCPNYQDLKKWLDNNAYEFDFLAKNSELHN